jgi:hypothetical protein
LPSGEAFVVSHGPQSWQISQGELLGEAERRTLAGEVLTLDAYVPLSNRRHAAVVLVHGGGWEAGDRVTYIAPMLALNPTAGVSLAVVRKVRSLFWSAIGLGIVQFGDWRISLVILVFVLVQMAEGLFISPKIIGDRVGLHPLTVIVALVVGTTLMGGIVGGILAIPFTAVLRTLMFRYIWKRRPDPTILAAC